MSLARRLFTASSKNHLRFCPTAASGDSILNLRLPRPTYRMMFYQPLSFFIFLRAESLKIGS